MFHVERRNTFQKKTAVVSVITIPRTRKEVFKNEIFLSQIVQALKISKGIKSENFIRQEGSGNKKAKKVQQNLK